MKYVLYCNILVPGFKEYLFYIIFIVFNYLCIFLVKNVQIGRMLIESDECAQLCRNVVDIAIYFYMKFLSVSYIVSAT